MGAWNCSLTGNDHVQDALFEEVSIEYLYFLYNQALKEANAEKISEEFLDSYEREKFVGVVDHLLISGDLKNLNDSLVKYAKDFLLSLRKWGHIANWTKPELRVKEIDLAIARADKFLNK